LEYFKDRLLREWSSITGDEMNKLRSELNLYIQESLAKVKVD